MIQIQIIHLIKQKTVQVQKKFNEERKRDILLMEKKAIAMQ